MNIYSVHICIHTCYRPIVRACVCVCVCARSLCMHAGHGRTLLKTDEPNWLKLQWLYAFYSGGAGSQTPDTFHCSYQARASIMLRLFEGSPDDAVKSATLKKRIRKTYDLFYVLVSCYITQECTHVLRCQQNHFGKSHMRYHLETHRVLWQNRFNVNLRNRLRTERHCFKTTATGGYWRHGDEPYLFIQSGEFFTSWQTVDNAWRICWTALNYYQLPAKCPS